MAKKSEVEVVIVPDAPVEVAVPVVEVAVPVVAPEAPAAVEDDILARNRQTF
jgi:hypothetical protein